MYTPEIVDVRQGVKSWIDDFKKKEKIGLEYQLYQRDLIQGKITINMGSQTAKHDDPEIQKQDTSGITGFET
jgi:hypothetical protein